MLASAQLVEQGGTLFGCNLEVVRKPTSESTVQQRIAGEKHENDGKKRNRYCANDHFGFEASAKLFPAAFCPQTKNGAGKDQGKNDQSRGDERRDGVEGKNVAPVARLERSVERPEGEDRSEKERENDAGKGEAVALTGSSGGHRGVIGEFPECGRNSASGHVAQSGFVLRQ